MADDNEWDVEKYRNDYESDDHWELKRTFIETHKNKFDEDELICLTQVFFNVELLGCKYNTETMRQISELSKGIVEKYRNSRKNTLKRTFIGGADAAKNKVQRR
ncbi:hypothetical protein PVAND_001725 [Polypedilum vanderplanki]|uniref:XRN2-binding (XTBD) domain-containing protein n=1 Tax=Polypedilum vanderplanki TaxID=319348 RepID=A0A9J6BQ37_POLVA|nr:hypothetical protein PVAND_001725 [Polypedilum vanderplanki]